MGERSRESYRHLRAAGADRYLLRHETATAAHYRPVSYTHLDVYKRQDMVKFNGAFVTPGDCFEEPKSFRVGYGYSDDTAN